jgi:penicillin-binding protein 1A
MRELVGGYTVFESGVYREPISYHKVVDGNGNIILDKKRESYENAQVVLKKENAAIMTRLLEGVVRDGTAKSGITLDSDLGISVAGKTGTTQNNCDRWFVGYTPRLLAGVWLGYDYPSELVGIDGNPSVRIWDAVMIECERGYDRVPPKSSFDECDGIVKLSYCADSGEIPCPACLEDPRGRRVCEGWFSIDNMPSKLCDTHVLVEYDRVFGGVCINEGPAGVVKVSVHVGVKVNDVTVRAAAQS